MSEETNKIIVRSGQNVCSFSYGEQMKIEKIDINKIIPYENNAKLHPNWQIEQIKESIKKFGNNDPIAVDENNVVIEGHGRLLALKELGYKEAEIIRLTHLSDEEKRAYILAHNKLTMNTNFDIELLEQELFSIEEIDMEEFGFDLSDEYENFIDKFQTDTKKTTDDCYTPQNIYDAIKDYVIDKYSLKGRKVVRPFYPGGDYQNFTYPKDCVVIDNPPFSILSEIVRWYNENEIDYFLFAPYLKNFGIMEANHVVTDVKITYENGAVVNTAFLTNLGEWFIESDPKLQKIISEINRENTQKYQIPNYEYPDEVVTSATIGQLAKCEVNFKLRKADCYYIKRLEHQKEHDKKIFGDGYLTSKAKAKELVKAKELAKEKAKAEVFRWELSDNEKAIVEKLGE